MTWEELLSLLSSFGEKLHVIRGDESDAVSLQVVPFAWFVSIKSSGVLNVGTYEGDENRLVGTRSIPLAELTPEFVRAEVAEALGKQIEALLDPAALRDYFAKAGRRKHPRF